MNTTRFPQMDLPGPSVPVRFEPVVWPPKVLPLPLPDVTPQETPEYVPEETPQREPVPA